MSIAFLGFVSVENGMIFLRVMENTYISWSTEFNKKSKSYIK